MEWPLKNFLAKLAMDSKDDCLSQVVSGIIRWQESANDSGINGLLSEIKKDFEGLPEIVDFENKDFRIKLLALQNFRKFPRMNSSFNISWGIKCCSNDEPCSVFLVGGNGTGKTSLYSAIEYLYTGRISAAKERRINIENDRGYMKHGLGHISDLDPQMNIYLSESEVSNKIGLQTIAFCSDYDIYQLLQGEENLASYILTALGYGGLREMITSIGQIIRNWDENEKEINIKLSSENLITYLTECLKGSLDKSEYRCYQSQINDLKELLKKCNGKLNNVRREDLSDMLEEIHECADYIKENAENDNVIWETFNRIIQTIFQNSDLETITDYHNSFNLCKYNIGLALHEIVRLGLIVDNILNYIEEMEEAGMSPANEDVKPNAIQKKSIERLRISERNKVKAKAIYDLMVEDLRSAREYEKSMLPGIQYLKNLEQGTGKYFAALSKLEKTLKDKELEIYKDFESTTKQLVETILTYFAQGEEKYEFIFQKKEGQNVIHVKISCASDGEAFSAGPKEYFNTFRFKLYVVSLRIALAFSYMKKYKITLPIVLDDVFNAIDFENSLHIEHFVRDIYRVYNDCSISEKPLQVIMFTHDPLIMTSFRKGAEYPYGKSESCVICGRLFDYSAIRKSQEMLSKNMNNQWFYNLYIPL